MASVIEEISPENAPRVCIIGAGVSGLCTCRHLLKQGIRPTVLESKPNTGGVWRTNSVGITRLQTPSAFYQFSDFPWPDGTPACATASNVVDYIQSYAHHFGMIDCVRFNTTVIELTRGSKTSKWKVLVQDNSKGSQEVLEFDFVILCIGRFGDVPNVPSFLPGEGPDVFKGKVMHSSEYSALETEEVVQLLSGKRVVVVGFSKSALDIAAEAVLANRGEEGRQPTLLFRRPHWVMSSWKVFGIPVAYLFGNRFSELLVSNKPGQGRLSNALSSILSPLKWTFSKVVEVSSRLTLPLSKYGLIPDVSFEEELSFCKISVLPDDFFNYVTQGQLALCKSPRWHFTENGILLDGGKELEADVVILATGFQAETKLKSILPDYAEFLRGPGIIPLYRGVIHPRIPDMAILGYQEDLSNLRAAELGARWLGHVLSGKLKLPDADTMEESAEEWLRFMKRSSSLYRRACVTTIRIWHSDELCRDMGWNPRRKGSWLEDMFSPHSNMDYKD